MTKGILCFFGALLLTAALTVPSGAGSAQEIASGMLCSNKVAANSWHVCGAVPFNEDGTIYEGPITFEAAGSHEVTVFTTGAIGIKSSVEGVPVGKWSAFELSEAGVKQIQRSLRPQELGQVEVQTGDLVYVARADHMVTDRTVGVVFLDVPGGDLGAPAPASGARIRIELNSTTSDAGVQAFVDDQGQSWNSGQIIGPDQRIFQASGGGNLARLGLTTLAFESHAPTLEELLALFPEGEYEFRGRSVGADRLVGSATLTHDIPEGPEILTPEEGVGMHSEGAVVSWAAVTEPAGIEIVGYGVIVEGPDGGMFSVDLPAEATSVPVPADFLEPDTAYLLQVLAIEVSGNRTITERTFTTADGSLGAAEEIKVGDVCQKKIKGLSWHLCGAAPADGPIYYASVGSHELDVFTTGPAGITCPPGTNALPITRSKSACDILQIGQPRPLQTFDAGSIQASQGDLIYIARADRLLSERTLAIKFCARPNCG
jgi:hypothetical protein